MSSKWCRRLEITLECPNPLFEKWMAQWLHQAESRNSKSRHKLREALHSLRSYPLPLSTGRECAILRGFGTSLCNLIDDELRLLHGGASATSAKDSAATFHQDVQQAVQTFKKANPKEMNLPKPARVTKKVQKAIADEDARIRQVTMAPGSFRILLLVDTQELNGRQRRTLDQTRGYLETLGVNYEVRRLTVGDFLWIARNAEGDELVLPYIVERKRLDDLAASVRDGRFHEQKHRLRQSGIQNVVYLVENYGDNEHVGLPLESLQQAIANTQVQTGFSISRTDNHWRSMVYLQNITKTLIRIYKDKTLISCTKENLRLIQPLDTRVSLLKFRAMYEDSARNAQLTVREVFVQQLLQLHSLSLEKALAIVEMYPTPRLLFDAYDACITEREARLLLADIRCGQLERPIGEKISHTIYEFYRVPF